MGRRKPKTPPAPKPKRRYADMSMHKNAIPLSQLGAPVRTLSEAIYSGDKAKSESYFNHGYDKDPATNGGALPGDCNAYVYYFPATAEEIDKNETIASEGVLSGRRRLVAKVRNGGYPDYEEIWSFFSTNHPREAAGLRTNVYGVFTPIDPAK
jgi:hypothetical protein